MNWKNCQILFIVAGQHLESMATIINVEVTVPYSERIRIRKMKWTRAVRDGIFAQSYILCP